MIFVDAHVHIHNCFDLQIFLDSALANFNAQAKRCGKEKNVISLLLLTETKSENRFQQFAGFASTEHEIGSQSSKNWSFHFTDESCSLQTRCNGVPEFFIIAGRQIVTAERLEVLALATDKSFEDGSQIEQVINSVHDVGAIPVIPYGFGKWIGRRGIILNDLLEKIKGPKFFLGDNSGRAIFLPFPSHFKQAEKKGIRVLPGSDPLPFSSECKRPGSFGFYFEGTISASYPARDITRILLDPTNTFKPYGQLNHSLRFFRNQLLMQIIKRRHSS